MDKFSYFRSYHEALKGLNAKTRYAIREAIDFYMFEGIEPDFNDSLSKSIWSLLLPNLNKSKTYFDNRNGKTKEKQIDNKPTSNANQTDIKSISNQEQTHPIGKGIGEGIGIKEKKVKEKKTPVGVRSGKPSPVVRFIKPTLEQIKEYVSEKGYHFDAESFYAFYESKGWKVGNQSMKDWKMACVTWEKREPHTEEQEEVKPKPVPKVTQCPNCGSYELGHTLGRVMCRDCGAMFDYNHAKGKWEKA